MKKPEMLQTIVIHHFLSYEIVLQVNQKKKKKKKMTTPISIMVAKYGKMLFFYLKNYY